MSARVFGAGLWRGLSMIHRPGRRAGPRGVLSQEPRRLRVTGAAEGTSPSAARCTPPLALPLRSVLRNPELRLDVVADLHVLNGFLRGLEFVGRTLRSAYRQCAVIRVDLDNLTFDFLRRSLFGTIGRLALRLRGSGAAPQHEPKCEPGDDVDPCPHRVPPLVPRDVVDRARCGADAGSDEGALAGAITGSRSDRGAAARADGRSRGGPATRDREREHRHPDERCYQSLRYGLIPHLALSLLLPGMSGIPQPEPLDHLPASRVKKFFTL